MALKYFLQVIFVFILAINTGVLSTDTNLIARRGVNDSRFRNVKTAILTIDGKPTTCEIGLITPTTGLAAVSCFVIDQNGKWNTTTKYGVYLYDGDGSSEPKKYDVIDNNIYAANRTLATQNANLAVLSFDASADDTYTPYSVYGGYVVDDSSYKSRLLDFSSLEWGAVSSLQQADDPSDLCSKYNELYKANTFLFSCSNATIESVYDSNCRMPYGALYTMKGDEVALMAIYTHSVILGTDECKDPRINFYTYVGQFLPYASWVIENPINVVRELVTTTVTASVMPTVILNPGTPNGISGIMTVGANLYARFDVKNAESQSESNNKSTSTDGSDEDSSSEVHRASETPYTLGPDPTSLAESDSESSSTKNIVIGVVVGVGGAAIVVGILVFWCIKRRNKAGQELPKEQADTVASAPRLLVDTEPEPIQPAPAQAVVDMPSEAIAPARNMVPRDEDSRSEENNENPPSYTYIVAQRMTLPNTNSDPLSLAIGEVRDSKEKD